MNKRLIEEGTDFTPKFDESGLMPCVVQDHQTHDILMVAYMNQDALNKTISTGEAHYWSRSRQELWHKGAGSGFIQSVKELLTDCDQDCLILKVEVTKNAETKGSGTCHTGRTTCFYRRLEKNPDGSAHLKFIEY